MRSSFWIIAVIMAFTSIPSVYAFDYSAFYTFNVNDPSDRTTSKGATGSDGWYCVPYKNPDAPNTGDDAICFKSSDKRNAGNTGFKAFYTFNINDDSDRPKSFGRNDIAEKHYCVPLKNPDISNTGDDALCLKKSDNTNVGISGFYTFNLNDLRRTKHAGDEGSVPNHYCIPLRNPDAPHTNDDALCFGFSE